MDLVEASPWGERMNVIKMIPSECDKPLAMRNW